MRPWASSPAPLQRCVTDSATKCSRVRPKPRFHESDCRRGRGRPHGGGVRGADGGLRHRGARRRAISPGGVRRDAEERVPRSQGSESHSDARPRGSDHRGTGGLVGSHGVGVAATARGDRPPDEPNRRPPVRLDTRRGTVADIAVGDGALWAVRSPRAEGHGATLTRIDPVAHRVVANVALEGDSGGVAVGFTSVWVANTADDTLTRIDERTNEVLTRITVGDAPVDVVVGGWIRLGDQH
jgi:YVTN family beta-propeller protein